MWLLIPVILVAYLLTAYLDSRGDSGAAEIRVRASEELRHYKAFMAAADLYFKSHDAPSVRTRYGWQDIRLSAPPGLQGASMRPDWYAVRAPDGTWAACTQLGEEAVARAAMLFPTDVPGQTLKRVADVLVIGADDAAAAAAADLCK
ncbi:hypothetical protein [Xylophilus sp. ASV27]|uniref:hypothetical protein n=1 Tax=Xylophilus sp. ASV27 TaxID=2795129 RepID=UPI0018EC1C61|nr:hypothetical protein [Xylophilus sp. ASV27]